MQWGGISSPGGSFTGSLIFEGQFDFQYNFYAQDWRVPVYWKPTSRITSRANPARTTDDSEGPSWSMEAGGTLEGTVDLVPHIGFTCLGAPGWTVASTAVFNRAAGNELPGLVEFVVYPDQPVNLPANVHIPNLAIIARNSGPVSLPAGGKLTTDQFYMDGSLKLNSGTFVFRDATMDASGTAASVLLNGATIIFEGSSWVGVTFSSVVSAPQSWLYNRGTLRWPVRGSETDDQLLLINYGTAYLGGGSGNGYVSNGTVYLGYDYTFFDPTDNGDGSIYSPELVVIMTPTSVTKMRIFDPLATGGDDYDSFNGGGDFTYLDGELTVEFVPFVDWAPPAINMTFDVIEFSYPTTCSGTFKTVTPVNFPSGLGLRLEYVNLPMSREQSYSEYKITVTVCSTSDSTCGVVPTTSPFSATVFPTGISSKIPAGMWTKPANIPTGAPPPRSATAPSGSSNGAPGSSNGGAPGSAGSGAPGSGAPTAECVPNKGLLGSGIGAVVCGAASIQLPFLLIVGLMLASASYLLL